MPELIITTHARGRLDSRGISEDDVKSVLARPLGDPQPGDPGNIVLRGYGATGGRVLKVVVKAADRRVLVSAFWEDGTS